MSKGGRPSKFEVVKDIIIKIAAYGLTDQQMSDVVGVTKQTLNNWKKENPEFFDSLKESKLYPDSQVVRSLFERANGYSHMEDKIFNDNGDPLIVPTIKHYPPDTTACIFWLKNRQPELWRDVKNVEMSGEINNPFKDLTTEELRKIAKKK